MNSECTVKKLPQQISEWIAKAHSTETMYGIFLQGRRTRYGKLNLVRVLTETIRDQPLKIAAVIKISGSNVKHLLTP